MAESRSSAYPVWHLMDSFFGRRRGSARGKAIAPPSFVAKVTEFLGERDFVCALGVPCYPRVERIERSGDERVVDLAVRFELVGTAETGTVPQPTEPGVSATRERRCDLAEETRSFSPLYHFTFRSDEAFMSNAERFREFLKRLPASDSANRSASSSHHEGPGFSSLTAGSEGRPDGAI
jgi:hypothetical protein